MNWHEQHCQTNLFKINDTENKFKDLTVQLAIFNTRKVLVLLVLPKTQTLKPSLSNLDFQAWPSMKMASFSQTPNNAEMRQNFRAQIKSFILWNTTFHF